MNPVAIIVTVAAYIAAIAVAAWWTGHNAHNIDFFTANRRTNWQWAALAMVGAAMSGVTFISIPGSVAADSFSYMQMVAGFTIGQLIVAFVLVPMFYRLNVISLYGFLDSRFGIVTRRTGAWCFFVAKILAASLKIYIVCEVLQWLVFDRAGIPLAVNAAATMTLVWLYTRRGGVKSLIWTDSIHTICLVAAVVVCTVCVVKALGWNPAQAAQAVAESPYSQIFFFENPASDRYFWKMFAAGIFTLVAMTGLDQDMMQRNLSCRSVRDAQINIIITAVCQIVVIFGFLVLGALFYIFMERSGITAPAKSDLVFATVAMSNGMPAAVGVMFIIGMVASTWSSAGSALTALTTSFTLDILPHSAELGEEALARRRKHVHAAMAAAICAAIFAFGTLSSGSVINLIFTVVSYTYGPILGMFCFGMFTHRAVRGRAMPFIAVAAPVICAAVQQWAAAKFGYRIGFELLIYNAVLTMAGMYLSGAGLRNDKHKTIKIN